MCFSRGQSRGDVAQGRILLADEPVSRQSSERFTEEQSRRPVGLLAMIVAIGIAVFGLRWGQSYAVAYARPYVHAVGSQPIARKWLTLTLQRAALHDGRYLLMYGSSELFCCGEPYYATQVYSSLPTGFDVFTVGSIGSGDLQFLEIFGALGGELRGKKLVLSVSPPYFFDRTGIRPDYYAGNFSPEIAEAFIYSTVALDIREAGARRMRDYPATLKNYPLLRRGVTDLADPTPLHLLEYDALYPLARVESWVFQLQDAYATVKYLQHRPQLLNEKIDPPPVFDWEKLLKNATDTMADRGRLNPFGFPQGEYERDRREEPDLMRGALTLYCQGQSNRDGGLYPYPAEWVSNVQNSAEWTDLDLELRVLREVGARPLVYTLPLPGVFDNYTEISRPARAIYYDAFAREMARYPSIAAIDFRQHDEDRFFLTDISAHFSARGWVFVNRALDLFWHDEPVGRIQATLDAMNQLVPPVGEASPRPGFCRPADLYSGA